MAKAILTTKVSPSYDDRPEEYYHFPSTYLNQVRAAVGDHIIYYEPRRSSSAESSRGGRQAYFATARIDGVIEDKTRPGYFYALVSNYLDFDSPVPFAEAGTYYESALRKSDGTTNKGSFGRAVRLIPDVEFDHILKVGFASELSPSIEPESQTEIDEPFHEYKRPIVELTISRPFRDEAFKRVVRSAYGNKCAFTGLQLINGGGRPEVQAAHIMPVASNGPDSVRNGLALSGTIHWMFDRGLVSVDEHYRMIMVKNGVPEQLRNLFNQSGNLVLPNDRSLHPHPYYLKFHREKTLRVSEALTRRATCAGFCRSCCQMRSTLHPSLLSCRFTALSRSQFRLILRSQNERFEAGILPCMGQPCQKQPSTNTASRALGNMKSGFPNTSLRRCQPRILYSRKIRMRRSSVA